jgi:hypothetical protein
MSNRITKRLPLVATDAPATTPAAGRASRFAERLTRELRG